MRNTGKPSERQFEDHYKKLGAYVYRVEDAAALYGKNKRAVANDAKPCDYYVVLDGHTIWAEVKSTTNETSFPFGIIKTEQLKHARQVVRAGGRYFFFVHSLHLDQWFRVPAELVIDRILSDKKSFKWTELKDMRISIAA